MKRTLLSALVLGLSLLVVDVAAQKPVSPERKQQLNDTFATAQEHYKAERYTQALPLFQEVADELDSPNALLYVGRCMREMGRLVEAYDALERTVEGATARAASEKRFQKTAEAAQSELDALKARVGRLRVTVQNAPAGAEVEVDGKVVAPDDEVIVAPGRIRVEVRSPTVTRRSELDVTGGSNETITIDMSAEAEPPPPSPPPPGWSTRSTGGGVRIAGFAVMGVGLLGWAGVIAFGLLSDDKFAEVQMLCGETGPCTTEDQQDTIDEGQVMEIFANVGIGVGIAGTVAGTLMVIFGGPTETAVAPPVSIAPLPGGVMMTTGGSF